MRTRKMMIYLIVLMILIFPLSPSGIVAMEKNKTDLNLKEEKKQDILELIEWKGIIANNETGESIEINSKDDKQLVTQSTEPQLVYFNDDTGEKEYLQEININIPENVDQHGGGRNVSNPTTDGNNDISVALGIGYSMGDSGIYDVLRIDAVYANWEIIDPTVRLTDVELGYRIIDGIGVENGAVNELVMWDVETDANAYKTEKIAPSPWFLRMRDYVHCKTILSGNLIQEDGKSRSMVIQLDLGLGS